MRISEPQQDAAVLGREISFTALVSVPGQNEAAVTDGVSWSSSDERVATIDGAGVLSPLSAGTVVITASVKNTRATRSMDVVPDVAGTWTFDYVGTACTLAYDTEGCLMGKPWSKQSVITIRQDGTRLSGAFDLCCYLTGNPGVTGRVSTKSTVDLRGENCSLNDLGHATRYSLLEWHMDAAPDGGYSGATTWEQASSPRWWQGCTDGEPTYRADQRLAITNFRRR